MAMTLEVVRVYALSCDAPGCDTWSDDILPRADSTNRGRTVRKHARDLEGWVVRDGRDLCPVHAKDVG